MRDIRARISHRHGIDLSASQIHELAARRLEAILDPRNVSPSLLDQLRKAAGARSSKDVISTPEPAFTFTDTTIYESHRSFLSAMRKLLNPILRLFFNPTPIASALTAQARLNSEQAARESEQERRQTEWNALQYELLQRVVTESARSSIELQALTLRVESLAARVDFTDRRVRTIEAAPAPRQGGGGGRQIQEPQGAPLPVAAASDRIGENVTPTVTAAVAPTAFDATSPDGQRKRRRRRRGRRSGSSFGEGNPPEADSSATKTTAPAPEEFDEGPDEGTERADGGESEATPFATSQDTAPLPLESPAQSAQPGANVADATPDTSQVPVPPNDPGPSESTS